MRRPTAVGSEHQGSGYWTLVLGSVGVVYGDIGTSPLYALREALHAAGARRAGRGRGDRHRLAAALGADPDRHAEVRRADPARRQPRRGRHAVAARAGAARGRAGARRFSSCSACSGRRSSTATRRSRRRSRCSRRSRGSKLVAPAFDAYIVPITVAIIVALFLVQSRGTARVVGAASGRSRWSGSSCMAVLGLVHVGDRLAIFDALNPAARHRLPASTTGSGRCRCWARCSSRSPAPRRSTPTWATSAAGRSASPGSGSSSRRWR